MLELTEVRRETMAPRPERPIADTPVAQRLHRAMVVRQFPSKRLAKVSGVNETYIRDILIGKSKNPQASKLQGVADALRVDLLFLTSPEPIQDGEGPGDSVDTSSVLPLGPAEAALIRMWRILREPQRDRVLDFAASMLPGRKAE